jgi:excisionase family DNA binding protein|tara:strand:- start:510 stop:791 length:282 start_codon:yes stop_codon:yes gene_type:complete
MEEIRDLVIRLNNIEELLLTQKTVLKLDEVILLTGLSKSYLYKLTSTGGIPCYKPQGKHIYFKKTEVEDWLLQNRKSTTIEIDEMANNHIILK